MEISILGSTGSIGTSALDIVRSNKGFQVYGLSANSNAEKLAEQIKEFRPKVVCVNDLKAYEKLKHQFAGQDVLILAGEENIPQTFAKESVKRIVMAITGVAALKPLIAAIQQKKSIALANKEAVVAAGRLIHDMVKEFGAEILPVDSEHSAIWQCLHGEDPSKVQKVHLTASGGSFRNYSLEELSKITPEQATTHPRWKMGKKITVDASTLMNKGLEVIEAMNLFHLSLDQIEVLVHPESIIHSMVEFIDGTVMAELGTTDMRIPIQYALTYPEKSATDVPRLNFPELGKLTFEKPNFDKFPCLGLALRAAGVGGSAPCVLNAANEAAVSAFLAGQIGFTDIAKVVDKVMSLHKIEASPTLSRVFEINDWAFEEAEKFIAEI